MNGGIFSPEKPARDDRGTKGGRQEVPPAARDITGPTIAGTKPPEARKGHSCSPAQTHTRESTCQEKLSKINGDTSAASCSSAPPAEQSLVRVLLRNHREREAEGTCLQGDVDV